MRCYNCKDQGAITRPRDGLPFKAVECGDCGKKGVARAKKLNARDAARSTGVNHHRTAFNMLEASLAAEWGKLMRPGPGLNGGYDILQLLMAPSLHSTHAMHHFTEPKPLERVTERDYLVAATVIQWLGSNCGRCFLEAALQNAKE